MYSKLQQSLPFTVLKRINKSYFSCDSVSQLQQSLPFTVLKPFKADEFPFTHLSVATVLTVYGIETCR